MNRFIIYSLFFVLFLSNQRSSAQSSVLTMGPVTATTIGAGNNEQNSGTQFHQLVWRVSGTVSTCTVTLDSSTDGISWSAGGVITGQTCTSNGSSAIVISVVNFVRINLTAISGGGNVIIIYNGYAVNPSGGMAGPVSSANNSIPTFSGTGGSTLQDPAGCTLTSTLLTCANAAFQGKLGTGNSQLTEGVSTTTIDTAANSPGIFNTNNGSGFFSVIGTQGSELYAWLFATNSTNRNAFTIDTNSNLTNTATRLLRVRTAGVSKIEVDPAGDLMLTGTIQDVAQTAVAGIIQKKGTGVGNYASASTTFVAVDGTNLTNTVTIPTGWKLAVQVSGAITTSTAIATATVGITDGSCSGSTVTLQRVQAVPTAATNPESFSLSSAITGDGASHTINLCYLTSNGADSVTILNSAADLAPVMLFTLMPSN